MIKNWLKSNKKDLPVWIIITTWLVLVWLFDPEGKDLVITIVAIAIAVAVGKTIITYVKWVKIQGNKSEKDAQTHFELAVNYLSKGDRDSAIKEYKIVEELDKTLASELYDRIFS